MDAAARKLPTLVFPVRRVSVVSSRPFDEVVHALDACIGRPDMNAFRSAMAAAATLTDLEALVDDAVGPSGLMEFVRFDSGEVLRKERGGGGPRMMRFVVGNPLIMKEMARAVPDAASYAPVTILVDERADGVHLSYDTMASAIAPYGSASAFAVAKDLDAKVERLLEAAAG
jgi:uncharacterized protein (DUF302 family)